MYRIFHHVPFKTIVEGTSGAVFHWIGFMPTPLDRVDGSYEIATVKHRPAQFPVEKLALLNEGKPEAFTKLCNHVWGPNTRVNGSVCVGISEAAHDRG